MQLDREIYIMNADGTSQQRLTFNNDAEAQPAFSPDGAKIALIVAVDQNDETVKSIRILDASNSSLIK